jgi:murein DD-endopeptidase MepM/ murein hydrolase activator NlpD
MSANMMKGSAALILAGGLVACSTTPAYPTNAGQTPAATTQPAYPVNPTPQPPAPPAVESTPTSERSDIEPQTAPAPISPAVQSAPLAPVSPAPQAQSAPSEPAYRPPAPRYGAAGKVVEPHGMFRDYVVRRHDHLYAIARDLQTTPRTLIKANHLRDPEHLVPGQHLKVPVDRAYVVQPGDTVALVAKRFSVPAGELADLNDLTERARLSPGDQLALPSDIHDRGPVELPPLRLATAPTNRIYQPPPSAGIYTPLPSTGAAPGPAPLTPRAPLPEVAGSGLSDTQIAALAHSRFIWPVRGEIISTFGAKGLGVRNDGVDVRSPEGSVVRASAPGDVVYAGNQIPGFGNLVLLQHADGWVTAYAHLERMSVQMRQQVGQGQEIGEVGTSGGVSEPQLHFEVRYKGSAGEKARPIDPLLVLPPA